MARRIIHYAYAQLRLLARDELTHYVAHRCAVAGAARVSFDERSLDAIFEIGHGNLRATDDLAFKSLDYAAAGGHAAVSVQHVVAARRICGHDVRRRTVRLPAPSDLPLGPLLLLELAAAVAANALRAHHVAIEGDFFPGETDEVTTARVLARECDDSSKPSTTTVAASKLASLASVASGRFELSPGRHRASRPDAAWPRSRTAAPFLGAHAEAPGYCQTVRNEPASAGSLTAKRSATSLPQASPLTANRSATSPAAGRATRRACAPPAPGSGRGGRASRRPTRGACARGRRGRGCP